MNHFNNRVRLKHYILWTVALSLLLVSPAGICHATTHTSETTTENSEQQTTEKTDTEEPTTEKQDTQEPTTEKQDTEEPSTEKQDTEEPTTEPKPATYTVRYYKTSVASKNLLGSNSYEGMPGDKINIAGIDVNTYKPVDSSVLIWTDGLIQDDYDETIKENNKSVINIVYAATYCDITALGANGYDAIDDTAAIQAALDYASVNYANTDYVLTVNIPDGTYFISKTLYIQPNTTLTLSNNATIIRTDGGITKNMLKNSNDKKHLVAYKKAYNLGQNIHISGGTWDGGDIYSAKSTSNLLYFGHATNITIENTTIKNCYGAHAIELAGVKDSSIRNCKISGFRYGSDNFTSEAIQLDICYQDEANGKWAPGFAVDKTTCTNVTVENCTITDYPRGIGIHHTLKGYECSNITFNNNTFKRSSVSTQGKAVVGIFLWGAKNVNITNNKFNYYSYGAMIKVSSKLKIKKNTFKYNNSGCLILESCDKNNARRTFTIKDKSKLSKKLQKKYKKKFIFTAPYIKTGNFKIKGKKYKFTSGKSEKRITLKKKVGKNVKVNFYGKDTWGNIYYQTRYTPRKYTLK